MSGQVSGDTSINDNDFEMRTSNPVCIAGPCMYMDDPIMVRNVDGTFLNDDIVIVYGKITGELDWMEYPVIDALYVQLISE